MKKKTIVFSMITITTILISLFSISYFNKVNLSDNKADSEINNNNKLKNDDNSSNSKTSNKYIKNILLLGIDSGEDNIGRSDCIVIATLDTEHNKIKLSSIIRDSYVLIHNKSHKDKINHAYAFGGPELTLKTLNDNFNLDLTQFVSVNLTSFPVLIDSIGGITLDINENELKYINKYIHSLNSKNNTSSPDINSSGIQHVDGTQALAYTRIRYTDGGDFERSHRQRIVLETVFEKLKDLPITSYPSLLDNLLPLVSTNLNGSEILSLCMDLISLDNIDILEHQFPENSDAEGKIIDGIYYYVFDEESTIKKIHKFIYEN
ncbi:LCP family protein [uncultured Clostridium sp.]|uniref:LCP family protein n=1 Tax=uncultured Clostridium sp. TaxID=59620 RepID=UPI0025D7A933|nr:LCP family protein [uncultured Clostridium sp.]